MTRDQRLRMLWDHLEKKEAALIHMITREETSEREDEECRDELTTLQLMMMSLPEKPALQIPVKIEETCFECGGTGPCECYCK